MLRTSVVVVIVSVFVVQVFGSSTSEPAAAHGWHDEYWAGNVSDAGVSDVSLILPTVAITIPSLPPYDPCRALCDEFVADRRGDGFDLCNSTFSSACTQYMQGGPVCSNLFWSRSAVPGSEWGLVYGINFRHLTIDEIGTPVLCQEADDIVYNEFNATEFNRTSFAYPFYQDPEQDPCRLLCEDFTADFRGNGDDLCQEPSVCVNAANEIPLLCTNLFHSHGGLVFSTELPELERLTCIDAEAMVDEYNRVNRTKIVTSALHVLVRMAPVSNLLDGNLSENSFAGFLRQFRDRNDGLLPSSLNRHVHNHAHSYRTVIGAVTTFMSQLNLEMIGTRGEVTSTCCGQQEPRISPGPIHLQVPHGNRTSTIPLVQLILRTFSQPNVSHSICGSCRQHTTRSEITGLNSRSNNAPIIAFNIHNVPDFPHEISFPYNLDLSIMPGSENLDNGRQQLFALVNASHDVLVYANNQWFVTANNTLVPANISIEESGQIVSADITTAFYQ